MRPREATAMADLPEIEVARRDLEREVAGRKFKSADVRDMKAVARHPNKSAYAKRLEGAKVRSFDRRGRFLVGKLDTDELWVLDLGATGALVRIPSAKKQVPADATVVWAFTQGGGLVLADPKKAAETFVVAKDEFEALRDVELLGLDPLESPIPWQRFGQLLAERKGKLRTLLLDPKFVVGIGPVYADEILFHAGLRHDRASASLSPHEVRRLYRALVETLMEAIKYRGTSVDEDGYVDMFGKPGEFNEFLRVYRRCGESCRRCRSRIERLKVSGRAHYYCPQCQS